MSRENEENCRDIAGKFYLAASLLRRVVSRQNPECGELLRRMVRRAR